MTHPHRCADCPAVVFPAAGERGPIRCAICWAKRVRRVLFRRYLGKAAA